MPKVLITEDMRAFAALLQAQIADQYGFESDIAPTYADAEKLLKESSEQYFVAIVDIHLPDAPEGEAIDLIIHYQIPCLVFTGQLNDTLREDIISKGIADYTLKEGQHNVDHVVKMVNRIYHNQFTKVLVVDDSRTARRMVKKILEIQRYQVLEAGSGPEALAIVEQEPDIRVAILDCFMEPMDGFTLANKLRTRFHRNQMAIIGVSGQGGQGLSSKFIKCGANDFLLKPFQPEEFFCRINHEMETLDMIQNMEALNRQKNHLLGMAAHDIRGPLSIIHNASNMLIERQLSDNKKNQLLSMVKQNSQQMLELLNSLLDVSIIESGKLMLEPENINLSLLVAERLQMFTEKAQQKSISLSAEVDKNTQLIADPKRLRQVLDNLISNALKYSPKDTFTAIRLSSTDSMACFEVHDQGPGIADDEQDKLFGAFNKLSNPTTGGEKSTGLGLAICKNIIEAHKGKIYYQASELGGSCFGFEIPIQTTEYGMNRSR